MDRLQAIELIKAAFDLTGFRRTEDEGAVLLWLDDGKVVSACAASDGMIALSLDGPCGLMSAVRVSPCPVDVIRAIKCLAGWIGR